MPPELAGMLMGGMGGGSGQGGLSQFLGGLFGNSGAPFDKAMDQYKKYYGQAGALHNPFYNAGVGAIPGYQDWLGKMKDPSKFINDTMGQYQESPWAKFQTQQGTRAANNSASASGLIGSTPLGQANADYARNISSQDMQSWLGNVLGINSQYGAGQNQLMQGGQNSANAMSSLLAQLGQLMGEGAAGSQGGQNQDRNNLFGGLLKMFGG